jgi:hypothetical protein
MIVGLIGGICGVLSLIYFLQSARPSQNSKVKSQKKPDLAGDDLITISN